MLSVLTTIGDFLGAILGAVLDFIDDLGQMIVILHDTFSGLPAFWSWLPATSAALIGSVFGVVVLYKILGREG